MKNHLIKVATCIGAGLLAMTTAHAVKLDQITINGQPYVEGMTVYGAAAGADGKVQITLGGRLTGEDADWQSYRINKDPDVLKGPYVDGNQWNPSAFRKYGGVPGVWAVGTGVCALPAIKAYGFEYGKAPYTPNLMSTAFPLSYRFVGDDAERCQPMFELTGKLFTDASCNTNYVIDGKFVPATCNVNDLTYGLALKPVANEDGTFEKRFKVGLGEVTLAYQLTPGQFYSDGIANNGGVTQDVFQTKLTLKFTLSAEAAPTDFRRSVVAQASGTVTGRSLQARFRGDSRYLGQRADVFVAAHVVHQGRDLGWYLNTNQGWQPWDGQMDHLVAHKQLMLTADYTVLEVLQNLDMSQYAGSEVWVAYQPAKGPLEYDRVYAESGL
ncbi:hypothetical protein [Parachitinimonas caeni]|uniref:Porin n=1 Tax=Parachitinimonas caeni TaxID=3031301 RepID=A0ABT7E308_9NEIS|nr:hypothetical protein [Parachitinimonas caeni]MDK2126708.1 hypothetical protein [Parachitinimonas caeni]